MSLIGVQSQSGIIEDASKLLAKKPVAWKLLGQALSLDFAKKIRAESPSTLIILRAADDNWSLDAGVVDYANRAMKLAQPFLSAGVCDFLEPPNEPVVSNDVDAKRLNEQMVSIASIYRRNGFKPLAYQFSVGNPPYELWRYLSDGILASDGYLGLHQYGAVTLQSNAADLSLRHRKVLPLLSPQARSLCKIIITECGLDYGIGRPAPDGFPTGGGYRNIPQQGDSENYWIQNFTSQLAWWDEELAKDKEVIATTLFGYAMLHPWETFDVSAVDTDRAYFINWIGSGTIPPPIGDHMTTPQERINAAWRSTNIVYNPDAAYPKIAQKLGLGRPVGNEYSYTGAGGSRVKGQGFSLAFLESPEEDVLSAKAYDWLTGLEYVPSVTPPNTNPPPTVNKRQTTADMPQGYGFSVESYIPKVGEKFWGLVSNGGWKLGQGTQILVQTLGLNGVPQFDVPVTHAYDPARFKNETFTSDGTGQVRFIEGHGNDFTPPAPPPDQFYVSANDGADGVWPTRKGDVVHMGQVGGHTEGTLVFQLMVG